MKISQAITIAFSLILSLLITANGFCEEEFDKYGGFKKIKGEATGFFHLKKIDGHHFLITPEGHGYRALGINHFHNMTSRNYDAAVSQIKQWGFNAGCYQGPRWMWEKYPYTKGINLVPVSVWKTKNEFSYKDVFDSDFLASMESSIRKIVEPQSENKMLIGYFWTDIPIWARTKDGGWINFYKSLPKNSAGGEKWQKWKAANPNADENEFLVEIAKQLYAKGFEFLRKYDKNHMIFGDRYHEIDIPEAIVREALPYIDAISIQPTSREFNFKFYDQVYKKYGKPIYIADHVSSFATEENPVTMGQAAKDPKTYSEYYRRYVTYALSRPYMIGFNKCQYQDQPTPKLLKQGLVKVNEQPYSIVESVRDANFVALDHAYAKTEPIIKKAKNLKTLNEKITIKIISPVANEKFKTDEDIVIKAKLDGKEVNGRSVRFYYLDEKWKLIGKDETAPYEATWKSPPPGEWDLYVAVHGEDWKILSKSRVRISITK